MRTDTETLIAALRILSRDIESGDGVANAAIAEGADRIEELNKENRILLAKYRVAFSALSEMSNPAIPSSELRENATRATQECIDLGNSTPEE